MSRSDFIVHNGAYFNLPQIGKPKLLLTGVKAEINPEGTN